MQMQILIQSLENFSILVCE